MTTRLQVANMAIGHTGEGKEISSFNENSEEARACKTFIDISRNTTLKELDWIFARKRAKLELLATNVNGWGYAYVRPRDCVRIFEDQNFRYREELYNNEDAIFCNVQAAELVYVSSDLPDRYRDDFALAWSYFLGVLIAPRVTEGNTASVIPRLEKGYAHFLGIAAENNENSKNEPEPLNEAIAAGGWVPAV